MPKKMQVTHSEGCAIAARYLKNHLNCGMIFTEVLPFNNRESPDAIGFRPNGLTVLMEVKVSREDFLNDKYKEFRKSPHLGMGDYRFYVCPPDIIKPEDLPEKWGLFYITPRKSLKPIVAPPQLTQLYSFAELMAWEEQLKVKGQETSFWHQSNKDSLLPFLHEKKCVVSEMNILYGGYRKICLASKANKPNMITEIYENPI